MLRLWIIAGLGILFVALLLPKHQRARLGRWFRWVPVTGGRAMDAVVTAIFFVSGGAGLLTAMNDGLSDSRRFFAAVLAAICLVVAGRFSARL